MTVGAREAAVAAVDVLFVDQAGQTALANVLAVPPAARNLSLSRDPRRLEQPVSAEHLRRSMPSNSDMRRPQRV